MTKLVVDSCVVVKWFTEEENSDEAKLLFNDNFDLIVPDYLMQELANVLWKKCKRNELDLEHARSSLAGLRDNFDLIEKSDLLISETFELSIKHNHPVYDCLYLLLATKTGAALVTSDKKLAAIAEIATVPVLQLGCDFEMQLIKTDLKNGMSEIVANVDELNRLARIFVKTLPGPSGSIEAAIETFELRTESPAFFKLNQIVNSISPAAKVTLMSCCDIEAFPMMNLKKIYYKNLEKVHNPYKNNLEQYIILHLLDNLPNGYPKLQSLLNDGAKKQG